MTRRPDLLALAGRVERAEAATVSLFMAAGLTLYPPPNKAPPAGWTRLLEAGAFTDAALAMMPEGWSFFLASVLDDGRTLVALGRGEPRELEYGTARTLALALLAAVLRARAEEAGE